eukprot:TRINITY_DN3084_c0_g2_i1.p2 TRINITY_DN3084_c0_g2~~TRINITY_DN3084_c0_g2_i1.p2  ORF type:complete len:446 (-),score=99.01 TRINITY_DN3084_c0_g2_i1:212-1549(-)
MDGYGSIEASKMEEFGTPEEGSRNYDAGYKDVWAAVVFLVQLLVTAGLALRFSGSPPRGAAQLSLWVFLSGAVSVVVALAMLAALRSMAKAFILLANSLQIIVSLCLSVTALLRGYHMTGVVLLLLSLANLLWLWFVREQVAYASLLLEHACYVVSLYPSLVVTAVTGLFCALGYSAVWGFAVAYSYQSPHQQWLVLWLVLCFHWSSQVIQNVLHVTAAGVVARWYFSPRSMPDNAVWVALRAALTTSFGSICLGSLLVAIVKFLHSLVERLHRQRNTYLGQCSSCLLGWLGLMLTYFNMYAFAHVAIYGKPYRKAAADCWQLVQFSGIGAVVNDSLVGSALVMVTVLGGLIVGCSLGLATGLASLCFLGALVGVVVLGVVMSVVSSSVITIYVCFAEEPDALRLANLALYQHIAGLVEEKEQEKGETQDGFGVAPDDTGDDIVV